MYSMVLMAALTTGSGAPDCWFHGHGGGYGGGCYGNSSYGCYGSFAYGGYGCYGSGYGYGGCYGGGYGCYGGGGGCYGGGYGCYGGGGGCYGGGYGCHGSGYGCHGSYGGWSCYGSGIMSPYMGPGMMIQPEVVPPPKKEGSETLAPTRARLIVELPGEATLYIDDQKMASTSSRRVFNTPELERGETYYYILRAEVTKDGGPVSVTKRVLLKPGEEIRADFRDLAAPAVTTVRLR
jgi:uncharacterized protein (TIGR03000 family)